MRPAWTIAALLLGCAEPVAPPSASALPESVLTFGSRSGKVTDYPCSQCHDKVGTAAVAAGTTNKHQVSLAHGPLKCVNCHAPAAMDMLQLPTGEQASFDTPQALCGQCHMARTRDWSYGAHGKSVGGWAGERQRLVCTDCHDAHHPARAMVKAMPAPPRPPTAIPKGAHR